MRVVLGVFLVLCLVPVCAMAQTSSTSPVTGTVSDKGGAVVPGATVELRNTATNETKTQTTNDAGVYTFASVAPGTYRITVSKSGFRKTVIAAAEVALGRAFTGDVVLEIGTVTETIEVTATAKAELQTLDSSVGNVLDRKVLENIPSLARDAGSILLLQPLANPGFNSVGSPNAGGEGDNTGGQVAGARSDQNTFLIDGGDATDSTAGGGQYSGGNFQATPRAAVATPIESLEEFRVVTTNSNATFARSAGGEVQMVTKRGGNAYHGAVYEYLQNNILDGNTWTRNSHSKADPALRDNRFGGRVGGPIWKDKTFFFAHYEGRRFVSSQDISRRVPSASMRAGILHFGGVAYNITSTTKTDPTTGLAVAPSSCIFNPGPSQTIGPCDPRPPASGGINPTIAANWNLLPQGNDPFGSNADGVNTLGFTAPVATPLSENFGVFRLDHVFNPKWQFMASGRYGKTTFSSPVQVDIGGLLPGDTSGVPKSTAQRPLAPRYFVAGLTGQVTSHLISEFRFDWLRHWWEWNTAHPSLLPAPEGFKQPDGLNAALSILGEGIGTGMQPINVDTQNARSRLWNGKDYNFFENLSWLKGKHTLQFGGRAGTQHFFHRRDDKVVGGLTSEVFTIGRLSSGSGVGGVPFPAGFSGSNSRWRTDYASVLGIIDRAQQLKTRASDFSPNPDGTPLLQHTIVRNYSLYIADTWRIKPSLTFSYGLNWGVQLPPYEENGEATMMVYHNTGQIVGGDDWLAQRKAAALNGQLFNPQLDFIPIKATGRRYPYDPYWTAFSPRVAVAWSPTYNEGFMSKIFGGHKGVLRGGYARVYDRYNGVGIVMIPALGIGFGNNLRCAGPQSPTAGSGLCGNTSTNQSNPSNAFRIGTDGTVLPFPSLASISGGALIPGLPSGQAGSSPFETLDFRIDPKRKLGYANTFDLTFQRELPGNMVLEMGYVGNYAKRLYQGFAFNQVPYMLTGGGQSFAQAFSNVAQFYRANPTAAASAAPSQGWFTAMVTGFTSLCTGAAGAPNATVAVVACNGTSAFSEANVFDVWNSVNCNFPASVYTSSSAFTAGCATDNTQIFDSYIIGSHGRSNYNAGFLSLRKRTSVGLTFDFNYTYSHAFDQLGQNQESLNETSDAFNLDRDYASAQFDRRHAFSSLFTYDLPFGHGRYSTGNWANKAIGGWNVSGVWVYATGLPLDVIDGNSCEEFGQGPVFGNCSGYLPVNKTFYSTSVHNLGGTFNGFADSNAVASNFRTPDLFLDTRTGRGFIRSMARWNVDFGISKTTKISERVSARFDCQLTNVFNHSMLNNTNGADVPLDLSTGSFGVLNAQYNAPRHIQFALRFDF